MKNKRKYIAVILTAALLCACSDKSGNPSKPRAVDENFSANAKITQGDLKCEATFKRGGNDTWECTFSSPDSIKGMIVTLSSDTCKIDYAKLTYQLERSKVPQASMISLVTKSLDSVILQNDLNCTEKDGTVTEKGSVNGQDFTATLKDGKIKGLEISGELTAEFT